MQKYFCTLQHITTIQNKTLAGETLWQIWQNKCHLPIFFILSSQIPDSLKQLMLAIVNSPTFFLPKLLNNQFAQVLPHQNFALAIRQLAISSYIWIFIIYFLGGNCHNPNNLATVTKSQNFLAQLYSCQLFSCIEW